MPEINNQLKKDTLQSPQSEKLLELRPRRSKFVTVLIPLVILLILIGGTLAFFKYYKPAPTPTVNNKTDQTEQTPTVAEGTDFYLSLSSDNKQLNIYKYNINSSDPDQKISGINLVGNNDNYYIVGQWDKSYNYAINHSGKKLEILDATTGDLTDLFDLPKNKSTRNVALSNNKQWLAYALNDEGDGTINNGEIWLYNLNTKESKQLVKPIKLDVYEGFSIIGWRDEDKEIIASAIGCDGGGCGGDIYEINVQTGTAIKVKNPDEKGNSNFLMGQLSPAHDKWLYDFCAEPDDKSEYERACNTGAELHAFDFSTKQAKAVYHNLRYGNNADKSMLQTLISYTWQDDKTVIAAVPGAMLSIDVSLGDATKAVATELFTYDGSEPQKFQNIPFDIIKATPSEIIYYKDDKDYIFNRVSNKIVTIFPQNPGGSIDWLY